MRMAFCRRKRGYKKWVDLGEPLGYGSYSSDRLKLVFWILKSELSVNQGHEGFRPEGRVTSWLFCFLDKSMDGFAMFGGPVAAHHQRIIQRKAAQRFSMFQCCRHAQKAYLQGGIDR
jgi:hypothetical protein